MSGSRSLSADIYVNGREFKSDSTSITAVDNSSKVSFDVPMILRSSLFILWIILSKTPPHQGALSILNCQLILFSNR